MDSQAGTRVRIEFDSEKHLYRLDGVGVPNVTRVLRDLFDWGRVPAETLEYKRQLGSAVHRAIQLDLADDLALESLDPEVAGYFEAWGRFRREQRFEFQLNECVVGSRRYRYAGTLDLAGVMKEAPVLIDVKTSARSHPAAALQTAAYLYAACEMGYLSKRTERYALYLEAKGSYRLEPHRDPSDCAVFFACLSRYNWQQCHALIKETI